MVTVMAEAGGETGEVAVTVTVTDENELGTVSGDATANYPENGTIAVATYTADGPDAASATWTLSGDDAGDFAISNGGELTFAAFPNYEDPADTGRDNEYMVTVMAEAGGETGEVAVTVTVTDENELGTVSGDATANYPENGTVAVATYTADGPDAASATWTLSGDDAGDFTISNGGELTFAASPNYEDPADTGRDNEYMVTVMAEAGGETGEVAVTVTVTDENELGTVSGDATANYPENGTIAVATYTADGPDAASATWTLSGDDAGDFAISNGGELTFAASPNYEDPADTGRDNEYMVTVMAEAGGETGEVAVTVTVTDENELGTVSGDATANYPENGHGCRGDLYRGRPGCGFGHLDTVRRRRGGLRHQQRR